MSSSGSNYQTLASARNASPTSSAATMTLTTTMTANALQQPATSQPRRTGIMARPSLGGGNAVLKLRGARAAPTTGRSVSWAEDVIDNEGLGRKKSKVCCIYRPPRAVDESSDESSSESDSDSDSDTEPDLDHPSEKNKGPAHSHNHGNGSCSHGRNSRRDNPSGNNRKTSPNAYERLPLNRSRDPGQSTNTQR